MVAAAQRPRNKLATLIAHAAGLRAHELLTLGRPGQQPPDPLPRRTPPSSAVRRAGTASEARAAALLAEGRPVREIAAIAGWQEGYVRRLLKRIYKKLGVSGQVSVVPRVLAMDALPRD